MECLGGMELDRAGDEDLSIWKAGSGDHSRTGLVSPCGTWYTVHRANSGARLTWKVIAAVGQSTKKSKPYSTILLDSG